MEPAFSEMFADIAAYELYVTNEKLTFKKLLLNYFQQEFEKDEADTEYAYDQEKMIHTRRKLENINIVIIFNNTRYNRVLTW